MCISACEEIGDASGYIKHPSYPWGYKNNIDMCWVLSAPQDYRLNIKFRYFKLEDSTSCKNDFVAVYDGPNDRYPLLNKFCGDKKVKMVVESSRNKMTVRMKTNDNIADYGFLALYVRIAAVLRPEEALKGMVWQSLLIS